METPTILFVRTDHTDEPNNRGVVLQIIYKIELFP